MFLGTCLRGFQVVLLLLVFHALLSAAKCTKPSIRREWRALSRSERAEWLGAVKCLASLPHSDSIHATVNPNIPPINTSSSYYDDLVYVHLDMGPLIYHNGYSFPWHRWFVNAFENALKTKCGFQGSTPYWDWRKDASDFFESPFFKDSDPESGLGGWGDPKQDFEVQDGAFGVNSSFRLSYPSPHPLRRNYTLQPFLLERESTVPFIQDPPRYANASLTYSYIDSIVNGFVGDFKGLQTAMDAFEGPVYSGHAIVGADDTGRCPATAPSNCSVNSGRSPNEPLFWLHHAMTDKIWTDWQNKDKRNANAFQAGTIQALANVSYFNQWPTGAPPWLQLNVTMPNDGMDFPASTIGDVLDTKGDVLCYEYE